MLLLALASVLVCCGLLLSRPAKIAPDEVAAYPLQLDAEAVELVAEERLGSQLAAGAGQQGSSYDRTAHAGHSLWLTGRDLR